MLVLSLLAGASLQSPDGPLNGPAVQRRRIALLALLATSPTGRLSRDKLIAYLWPESDTERARHLLSESVYVLRKALGENALLTAGDDLVLDTGILHVDVVEFDMALRRGDSAAAVTLYTGQFLDGFYLPDAPEFERWAETERDRLERAYQGVLESLAVQRGQTGDLAGAADAWRKLAARDPLSTRVALRLMQALDAAGERAAALRHAHVHTALLREELGTEPAAELGAYVDRLRESHAVPVTHVSKTPAVFDDVAPTTVGSPATALRSRRLVLVAIGIAVLLVGGWIGWRLIARTQPVTAGRTIAVLPFTDLSPEAQQEYFTEGLAEELINRLTNVEGLRVAARTSSFAFKGKDIDAREIGRKLAVETLLAGSMRREGNALRINARLVKAADGYDLWSEQYVIPLSDMYQVQEQIAAAITRTLKVRHKGQSITTLAGAAAPNSEAHLMYLRGRFVWNKRTPEGLQQAVAFFERALALDSGYAAAYAGLADTYITLYDYGLMPMAEAAPKVRTAASRALQLDPHLAEAHTSLAHVHLHDWNWPAAEREFKKAIELDPGRAPTYHWYALALTTVGRVGDAVEAMRMAVELDPLSVRMNADLGMALFAARDYDRAIEQERRTLELEPDLPTAHWIAAMAYEQKGMIEEANRELQRALARRPNSPNFLASLARLHALSGRPEQAREVLTQLEARARAEEGLAFFLALGYAALDRDRAFHWLGKAFDERSGSIRYLKVDARLDALRADPRYRGLLQRAGLQP